MEATAKVREVRQWQKISGTMSVIFMQKELKECSTARDDNHPWDENAEVIFVSLLSKQAEANNPVALV